MKRRSSVIVSILLSALLGVGPLVSLASTFSSSKTAATKHPNRTVAAAPKAPFSSSLLSKRPPSRGTAQDSVPGQSTTLLPNGALLKAGGLESDGPTARCRIEGTRADAIEHRSMELKQARAWHTATLLPDGKILVLGGISESGGIASPEILDPSSGVSELLDELPRLATDASVSSQPLTSRVYHTATLMTDGQVLIAGGVSNDGSALKTVETWDFRTRRTTEVSGRLRFARSGHTARLLANGNVLFSGSIDQDKNNSVYDEVYETSTGHFRKARNGEPDELTKDAIGNAVSQVVASIPANNARGVSLNSLVSLRFSRLVPMETVTAGAISLRSDTEQVSSRVTPAESGMLAFAIPEAPLKPGTVYTAIVTGLRAEDGSLIEPASLTFTTVSDIPQGQVWVPDQRNYNGDWTSGYSHSEWQDLPPLEGQAGVTALAGQVLRIDGWPLEKVILRIGDHETHSDGTGRFVLSGLETGRKTLIVDCRGLSTNKTTYGFFMIAVDIPRVNRTNALPYTIWMPVLDTKNAIKVSSPTHKKVIATTPLLPGLEVHIPRRTVLRDVDGHKLKEFTITPVPLDRGPFPGPLGVSFPMFFTLQLGGTKLESPDGQAGPGFQIVFPNYSKILSGARIDFWSYAAEGVGWYTYGHGTVTSDGKQIVPDPGVTIQLFTCASIGNPDEADGPACNECGQDGDPVDLGTGLFVYRQTDLYLPDLIPISLTRIYRPNDTKWRPFGTGVRHPYELFLVGDQTTYSYAQLVLPDGGKIRFDRISSGTGPNGAIMEAHSTPTNFYKATLTAISDGTGFRWDLRMKDGTVFRFPSDGRDVAPLSAIIDRNGNQLSIIRNAGTSADLASHRITKVISPNGRWIEFTYDVNFHITQATDNIGRTVTYSYDASGRLAQVTDPMGGVTQYTYDAANRMLTVRDARGIVYLTNQYDSNGRVVLQTQADNSTYQFLYTLDVNNKITQTDAIDPRGNHRTVTFNSDGYVLIDTHSCCGIAYAIERQIATNRVLSVTDPLGRRTEYSYDSLGNVVTVTDLAGTSDSVSTNYTYDQTYSQLTSITDPLNHTAQFLYDSRGRLTTATDPLGHQATVTYNELGQPLSVTDPLGNTTQFGYESGDLASVTSPLGQTIGRFTDAAGRLTSMRDPIGRTVRLNFDATNNVTTLVDPIQGNTSFSYDSNGNATSVIDAKGQTVSYGYDNMDRVTTRTDAMMRAVHYQYDVNGNLTQLTDRKSQVTSYIYDALDRLTLVTYDDNSTRGFTYDACGRVLQVTDSVSGTITYTYDNFDHLASETTSHGTVSYNYDAAGRRTSMQAPGQQAVNYIYDSANRLTEISQGLYTVSFTYDVSDRCTSMTLPNAVVVEYVYDEVSRVTNISYKKNGSLIGDLRYEYDVRGAVSKLGGTLSRIALPQTISSATYNSVNNQISFGDQSLTYDMNGNLVSDGVRSYTWNARNQLTSVNGPGLISAFQYDGIGRRTGKTVNGVTTNYHYDGAAIVQEVSGASVVTDTFTDGYDRTFSRIDASTAVFPLVDALGSTISLSDTNGQSGTDYTYEPFGKNTTSGGLSTNPRKYIGREEDETGLYYDRARYYSPALARFISEDPIGFGGGDSNVYSYVGNDPVNQADSSGLRSQTIGESVADPRNLTGAVDYTSAAALNDGIQRGIYASQASRINACEPLADLSRNNLADATRAKLSPVGQGFTDLARENRVYSGRGPLGLNRSAGSAARTSGAVNAAGRGVRAIGMVGLGVGIGLGISRIATAGRSCRARVAAEEVGGLAGSLAYGFVGAKLGASIGMFFGPWGALVGGVVWWHSWWHVRI